MGDLTSTPDTTANLIRALLVGLDGIARDVDTYEYGLPIYGEESYARLEGEVRKFVEAMGRGEQ